ncbi:MAG: hypothetical protein NZM10_07620 [Fimbriimonadales bacterium]|nr:hypothetical protein [Fimbriimonadales bacterium]
MIVPHNNRNDEGYIRGLRVARLWQNALRLWGVSADIIAAGEVTKARFKANYDFGIVPALDRLTYSMPVYSWAHALYGACALYAQPLRTTIWD